MDEGDRLHNEISEGGEKQWLMGKQPFTANWIMSTFLIRRR